MLSSAGVANLIVTEFGGLSSVDQVVRRPLPAAAAVPIPSNAWAAAPLCAGGSASALAWSHPTLVPSTARRAGTGRGSPAPSSASAWMPSSTCTPGCRWRCCSRPPTPTLPTLPPPPPPLHRRIRTSWGCRTTRRARLRPGDNVTSYQLNSLVPLATRTVASATRFRRVTKGAALERWLPTSKRGPNTCAGWMGGCGCQGRRWPKPLRRLSKRRRPADGRRRPGGFAPRRVDLRAERSVRGFSQRRPERALAAVHGRVRPHGGRKLPAGLLPGLGCSTTHQPPLPDTMGNFSLVQQDGWDARGWMLPGAHWT